MLRISTLTLLFVLLVTAVFVAPLHARRSHRPGEAEIEKLVEDLEQALKAV